MGDNPKNRITVKILGDEYTIRGSASPEVLQKAAAYVDRLMQEIVERNSQISRQKAAVLAALNLADELLKYRQDRQAYSEDVRERGDEDELV